MSSSGERNRREKDGKLSSQNNLLQISQQISEQGASDFGDKPHVRFLPQRGRLHFPSRSPPRYLLSEKN
ncbi:hypothetical protein K1719_002718 [Acacia pycnantha]|nr:hypothetical protein K1719_002718 [Acacia pycnantha]